MTQDDFNGVWHKQGESSQIEVHQDEIKLLKEHNVRSILDLGCGRGEIDLFLAKHDFAIMGLDINKEYVDEAKKTNEGFPVEFALQDIFAPLDLPDASFDAVVAYQSLNHNKKERILAAFQEVFRVLKPGGVFAIRIANHDSITFEKRDENIYYDVNYKFSFKQVEPQTYVAIDGHKKDLLLYAYEEQELIDDLTTLGFKLLNIRLSPFHIIANFAK